MQEANAGLLLTRNPPIAWRSMAALAGEGRYNVARLGWGRDRLQRQCSLQPKLGGPCSLLQEDGACAGHCSGTGSTGWAGRNRNVIHTIAYLSYASVLKKGKALDHEILGMLVKEDIYLFSFFNGKVSSLWLKSQILWRSCVATCGKALWQCSSLLTTNPCHYPA